MKSKTVDQQKFLRIIDHEIEKPGKPVEGAQMESINRPFRDQRLNTRLFSISALKQRQNLV